MIEITNYTTDTAQEFSHATDLENYIEECNEENYEIGVSHSSIIHINTLEDAVELLELSDKEHDHLQVVSEVRGSSYYSSLSEALAGIDEVSYIHIDGETTVYGCARALDYELYHEEDLYLILGCTKEAYEQLGSYISTDDIACILEQEYTVISTSNSSYIVL